MKKKTLNKTIFKSFIESKGRFLSIMLLMMLGSMTPRIFRTVDLPAPDEPRMIANSPFSISNDMSLFAIISDCPDL